ncbi:MAG TPA: zinc metallochaperone AztD [Nocardioides sp.]|nr:zinc metallochaperone AztD [Nocardioides sp.]
MKRPRLNVLLATVVVLGASACGTATDAGSSSDPDPGTGPDPGPGVTEAAGTEVATPTPRLAVTHDGGVMVVDVASGEVVADEPMEGFVRVSPAGDGRHALVSGNLGWHVLDLGSWGHEHGDHGHHYTSEPGLTGVLLEAAEAGHVVAHDGITTLFDDGTGSITVLDPDDLADGAPEVSTDAADEAHHGVAARLVDRNMLMTVGDEESRSGVRLVSPSGTVLAETDQCPGVHGEAFAEDVAVFGCEDGAVLVDGREMTKVTSPDTYGRVGNQAGSDVSPVLLGDYKTDPDAELERPTRVALVDTRNASLRLVELGTSYSFRSLGRGPEGEALVLGTDGAVHVLDPETGRRTDTIDVVDRWREPLDWQLPRPALHVVGGTAYVTDPRRDRVHVVDLHRGRVTSTLDLPHTPNEMVANAG